LNKSYLSQDEFNPERVNNASKACGPLCSWVVSQVNFSSILDRVQPLRDEVASLESAGESLHAELERLEHNVSELEGSIDRYKREYAELIRDIELIKTEMQRVEEKVNRSRDLIASLADERRRWEASKSQFNTQLSTLGGDTLVCAAFLAYAGYFDHKGRRTLLSEWRFVLETVGIKLNRESSLVRWPPCDPCLHVTIARLLESGWILVHGH
jgi:dynein heavy chain 1, cytosolic